MSDPIIRRLLANYLVDPQPHNWLVAADRFEELGEEESAKLWRRRGQVYAQLRDRFVSVTRKVVPGGTIMPGDEETFDLFGWRVVMMPYPRTVRVRLWWLQTPSRAVIHLIINLHTYQPAYRERYVTKRLLELADCLHDGPAQLRRDHSWKGEST